MNTVPDLPDLPDQADLRKVVSATAARSLPSTRAGGQDYGSLTNSLKLKKKYMFFLFFMALEDIFKK